MFISKVSIRNYRNFKNSKFIFKEGINTIIGENGAGKTNLFRALRLLLDDSYLQYSYKLSENDFNRSLKDWKGQWIIISIEFDKINNNEAIQSLFIHGTGLVQENYVNKATYTLFFRPKINVRQKLSDLKKGDTEGLNKILREITIKDYETFFTGKSTADFNNFQTYKKLVGDFEKIEFPEPTYFDASLFGTKIPHQLSISKEVCFTFIKALRDVVSDFQNNKTNPLLTLLKNKSGKIKPETFEPINELVEKLNQEIESMEDVESIREDIKNTIQDTVGRTYSPSSLSIKSSVPDDADKLLQSLKLFIGESDEAYEGNIHELSLGGANLVFLTLKLLEFKYQKTKDSFANFLMIEEPEAHIHTHIQKTLFDKLDYSDTQIIYSTHSTQISEVSNVENANILAKKTNYAEVYQPSAGLDPENISEVQRYLDAVRTNLLFAKGVILVEGDAEEILIPQLIKQVWGVSLDELGISLINIRSTGFTNVAQLFHSDRIRRKCGIITDLDQAICDTSVLPEDSEEIETYKKRLKRSESVGRQRKETLDKLALKNEWLEVFYATHTFEVDLIKADNAFEVSRISNKIYKDTETIELADAELFSNDVSIYGKRVITMAKHVGKGWFAILLAKEITCHTIIPEYIVNAVLFAKEYYSNNLIADIVEFRIRNYSFETTMYSANCKSALTLYRKREIDITELISTLEQTMANDQIISVLKRIELNVFLG
ncbi:AAA family ATPase [Pinibacter soli]|uniref:AAA family ATPase n=1 Tax=Pinibacter soli TaxID=3044211 RepID=A0ABT6RD63_9BACT|nr:AAA family ATPase [Pinibacter soli]MDI3320458.1 AAA family ATPase [Pinibacter soli]